MQLVKGWYDICLETYDSCNERRLLLLALPLMAAVEACFSMDIEPPFVTNRQWNVVLN
jgi:hypothetical protein